MRGYLPLIVERCRPSFIGDNLDPDAGRPPTHLARTRSSTCAADTTVIRPAITFDRISIRCRSRSLIAISPIRNLLRHQTRGE
nr:hypothetical protein [Rhizobium leguminosarum]